MNLRRLATAALISATAAVFGRPGKRPAVQPVEVAEQAAPVVELAPLAVEDVKGDIPSDDEVIEAARRYEAAKARTNEAARAKRLAEKVLSRTPDGRYGRLTVERHASTRKVVDLDEVKRIFAENGLGPVPMKTCAASLSFGWAAENEAAELLAA